MASSPSTLAQQIALGRRPFGLARCPVFEEDGDFMETSPFGWRTHPVTGVKKFHSGVDGALWTGHSLDEAWIVAPADGMVRAAEDAVPGFSQEHPAGNFVELDLGGSVLVRFLHLEHGTVCVTIGEKVRRGMRLGYMGKSGLATGEHLHLEVSQSGRLVDPEPFLKEIWLKKNEPTP